MGDMGDTGDNVVERIGVNGIERDNDELDDDEGNNDKVGDGNGGEDNGGDDNISKLRF